MSRRLVTEDERALWSRATRDVSPFGGRVITVPVAAPIVATTGVAQALAIPKPRRETSHRVVGGGNPRLDRIVGTRRLPIESVLDLHGMTQVEAHRELVRFVVASITQNVRTALVITGKGRRNDASSGGVLRARFLDWIEEPPLRGAIARVTQAKPKDGGAGAFYIYFKNKARSDAPRF